MSKSKKAANSREVMDRHVTACKKAFAEACRQMMLAVAMVAPDAPAVVKPAAKKPQAKKQAAKKPQPKPQAKKQAAKKPQLKPQAKKQAVKKPQPKQAQKPEAGKPEVQLKPHTRMPKSVRLTPHEVTLNLGSFNVKELAERDAQEFLARPNVFWYRGVMFPDPRRYGVQPSCERAKAVKRTDKKFGLNPWTVSVTIRVEGDDRKCDSWGVGVYTRNKADQE